MVSLLVPTRRAATYPGNNTASFVTAAGVQHAGTSVVLNFSGMAAGQLAVIYVNNAVSAAPSAPSGWSTLSTPAWPGPSYFDVVFFKVLSSADITATSVTVTGVSANGFSLIAAYTGCSSVNQDTTGDADGTSTVLSVTGLTKNASSKLIVVVLVDRDPASAFTVPAGFSARLNKFGATFFSVQWSDRASSSYTNLTAVTSSGFDTGNQQHGILLELI